MVYCILFRFLKLFKIDSYALHMPLLQPMWPKQSRSCSQCWPGWLRGVQTPWRHQLFWPSQSSLIVQEQPTGWRGAQQLFLHQYFPGHWLLLWQLTAGFKGPKQDPVALTVATQRAKTIAMNFMLMKSWMNNESWMGTLFIAAKGLRGSGAKSIIRVAKARKPTN